MTSKGFILIGPSVPQGTVLTNQIEAFVIERTLIGCPQFASYYKCTKAARDRLLEVVETRLYMNKLAADGLR